MEESRNLGERQMARLYAAASSGAHRARPPIPLRGLPGSSRIVGDALGALHSKRGDNGSPSRRSPRLRLSSTPHSTRRPPPSNVRHPETMQRPSTPNTGPRPRSPTPLARQLRPRGAWWVAVG